MSRAFVVDALRTAFGKAKVGAFARVRPEDYASPLIAALLNRHHLDGSALDDVIIGCAAPEAEQGLNIARLVSVAAGVPVTTSAMTVNRLCASSLSAIGIGAASIAAGYADLVLAGGLESMSLLPMRGHHFSRSPLVDRVCPDVYTRVGITAEHVARRFDVARTEQDELAQRSHALAFKAFTDGRLANEIIPVSIDGALAERDEIIRESVSLGVLAKLPSAFVDDGTVTAANCAPIADGASAVILASAAALDRLGMRDRDALGVFEGIVSVGVDPTVMGIGPALAIPKLLAKNGVSFDAIDIFEVNESFASQACYVRRALGIPWSKFNVDGGAIALGHPLGASGGRLIGHALRALRARGGGRAVVSMCVGGGMGVAALVNCDI